MVYSIMASSVRKCAIMAVVAMVGILSGGCTRNNGDIGPWFGSWHLMSVKADGVVEAGYTGDIFWAFQNNVVMLTRIHTGNDGMHSTGESREHGTWSEDDGVLWLNFTYNDDRDTEGYQYRPFPELHLPYGEISPLVIVKAPGREMVLNYTSSDGVVYTYTLKKQG